MSAVPRNPPDVGILHEPIVGAFGLRGDTPFVSIKGDPSLRETVPLRPRQKSRLDRIAGEVLETCAELLHNTGVCAIYIGFNSSEVRTESIFNPFSYEGSIRDRPRFCVMGSFGAWQNRGLSPNSLGLPCIQ